MNETLLNEQFYVVEDVPNTQMLGKPVFYLTGPYKTAEAAKASLVRIGTYGIVKSISTMMVSLEL
jgi:hypothetical protein